MENSIEEDIAKVNTYIELVLEKDYCNCNELNTILGKHCDGSKNVAYAIEHILSDYKRVQKENEELNKNYNFLIDKIILKIDEYDYKFKKAKKQNKNDIADYYWDLIINFKKLLGGE